MISLMSLPPEIVLRIITTIIDEELALLRYKLSAMLDRVHPTVSVGVRPGVQDMKFPIMSSVVLSRCSGFFYKEVPNCYGQRAGAMKFLETKNWTIENLEEISSWAWKVHRKTWKLLEAGILINPRVWWDVVWNIGPGFVNEPTLWGRNGDYDQKFKMRLTWRLASGPKLTGHVPR